jgi:single-stranded DNA-binding protein
MAIKVEFEAWVNEVREFDWGVVYNVAHPQRAKNHQGEWETTGYDYLDVTAERGFQKDDRVKVVGTLKTKRYDKKDGSKGISLQVRAESIEKVERNSHVNPTHQAALNKVTASVPDMQEVWPALRQVPDDTPF